MTEDEEDRTSAIGLFLSGTSYLKTMTLVFESKKQPRHNNPIYFLFGMGLELAFKSFERHKGATLDELIRLGHDLDKLLNLMCPEHLEMIGWKPEYNQRIKWLNSEYKPREFSYIVTGAKKRFELSCYEEIATQICRVERDVVKHFGQ